MNSPASDDSLIAAWDNINLTKADLGQRFFRQLIYNENSFHDVNEDNICSLMHFLFREATFNEKPIHFSSGMFVLYDSTERFFAQLMMAKNAQQLNNDHRSGYMKRLRYFAHDFIQTLYHVFSSQNSTVPLPLIYLRGDESSHYHERGNRHDRRHRYPAYGMDIIAGCLPNNFSHILFGQLKSLSNNNSYSGDRIYIKPEQYGIQQFPHYLRHGVHWIKAVSHLLACRFLDRFHPNFCHPKHVFHEWTDRKLISKWNLILSQIPTLTKDERRQMEQQTSQEGVREMYRQTLLFPLMSNVDEFRRELQLRYGDDVGSRKGDEIIFTTEQLLKHSSSSDIYSDETSQQCTEMM